MNKYKVEYKIAKDHELKCGEWITDLPASKICAWFEMIGWEVLYLNRVCQVYATQKEEISLNNGMKAKVAYYE